MIYFLIGLILGLLCWYFQWKYQNKIIKINERVIKSQREDIEFYRKLTDGLYEQINKS